MKVTVCASHTAKHQVEHQRAMLKGLAAHGIPATAGALNHVETVHVAVWGWRHGAPLRAAGHKVLVMERGYLGDRMAWTSLAWNGLNGRAQGCAVAPSPDRHVFRLHVVERSGAGVEAVGGEALQHGGLMLDLVAGRVAGADGDLHESTTPIPIFERGATNSTVLYLPESRISCQRIGTSTTRPVTFSFWPVPTMSWKATIFAMPP